MSVGPAGPSSLALEPTGATVDEVVAAVRAARAAGPVEVVTLRAELEDGEDRGAARLEPYVRAVKRSFDVLVGVDAAPPTNDGWIDRTYAMGADTLAYHLEVFGPAHFERLRPEVAARVGRERYLAALEYAATVFPRGAVVSNLRAGLEPRDSTLLGIERLAEIGVVPVLPDDPEDLGPHRDEALRRHRLPGAWMRLARGLGTTLGSRLSDLRRALRVKEVRESLDSSGL